MMRKVTIVSVLSLLLAGCEGTCETLRRVEVWKQHNFFAPNEPVLVSPTNPCNAARLSNPIAAVARPNSLNSQRPRLARR